MPSLANLGVPPDRWRLKGEGAANWVFSKDPENGRDSSQLVRGRCQAAEALRHFSLLHCWLSRCECWPVFAVSQHPANTLNCTNAGCHGVAHSEAQACPAARAGGTGGCGVGPYSGGFGRSH